MYHRYFIPHPCTGYNNKRFVLLALVAAKLVSSVATVETKGTRLFLCRYADPPHALSPHAEDARTSS